MISIESLTFATICYSDIFDYALDVDEIQTWFIGKEIKKPALIHAINKLEAKKIISRNESTVSLSFRRRLIGVKRVRRAVAANKWAKAYGIARIFKIFPTIHLVGVTGALAMNNSDADDDIDILIIVSPCLMWLTRAGVTLVTELSGRRRRPGDSEYKDKICLNMFMSHDNLALPQSQRDLYSAHEVLQMKPLWDRHNTYFMFLQKNKWARKYLPNAWGIKHKEAGIKNMEKKSLTVKPDLSKLMQHVLCFGLQIFESLARVAQLRYMDRRRTREYINHDMIMFHPHDARGWVRRGLETRLKKFNVPLDKIFQNYIK